MLQEQGMKKNMHMYWEVSNVLLLIGLLATQTLWYGASDSRNQQCDRTSGSAKNVCVL